MSILVAYRNSSAGRDALQLGIRLALSAGTSLDIVTVVRPGTKAATFAAGTAHSSDSSDPRRWLESAQKLVQAKVEVHTHLSLHESEARGILDTAHELGSRIIVLGTASGALLGRFSLGSVSNVLLHSADVAIALAPDSAREISQGQPLSRVSVAIGDIGGNRTMFETAHYLASRKHIPVRLLTLATSDGGREEEEKARTAAIKVLKTTAARHAADTGPITTQVEVAGRLDRAVEQVFWDDKEVVLIGSARIARQRTTFLGSTAAKLVRQLTVPMVVVPRDDQMPAEG
ncbi:MULTISPECIES: universal stress protein [unclassified Pseudoclavibacter]|uniref:universal stress protein n=1 Tax=unclassified Pseudoclavibacter TaxID=2615177 RepID=UPI001300E732|nr:MULTISPECIES: universal stress protein [unclassified Pseudoclavibacter]KAB1659179.1 universal stress protein [Pseudoclavibacter sp. CFCC 11306]KAB1660824.1 universal stress protein [Pseudoclavibacter sp. CFCC 13796]